jgi:aspartate/methionine/tyrosine aminotransferase
MNAELLISDRVKGMNGSGIRRVFDMKAKMVDPIDLSIGQPDFPVPPSVKQAAIDAIAHDLNGYTPTYGIPPLLERTARHVREDLGWNPVTTGTSGTRVLITSGTSGALILACMAVLNPGDEIIIPDPWFVLYPHLANLSQAKAVKCDTYPDFRLTADRVAKLITPKTKIVLSCSPGNPSGVVMSTQDNQELLELCRSKGILLLSDEIYDEFTYSESRSEQRPGNGASVCPSPARLPGAENTVLVVRGFGKTYGVTGWRLGYVAGPAAIVEQMAKLQQYLYVCPPGPLQHGAIACFDADMTGPLAEYERRRDMVNQRLSQVTNVAMPGGAFYAFFAVPPKLGMSGEQFFMHAKDHNVLCVPGHTFSTRDTHLRLSYATKLTTLEKGLDILVKLMS